MAQGPPRPVYIQWNMSAPPPKPPKPAKPVSSESLSADTATASSGDQQEGEDHFVAKGTKNVAELLAKDAEDESLRKYKESLLGSAAHGDLGNTSDPRRLVIEEFRIVFSPDDNLPEIVHRLADEAGLARLAREGITMKEGSKFKFRISFRVQHEIVTGIRFVNKVTRMLSEKEELVLGSYPPSSTPHVFEFPKWDYNEAPKGMMMRGRYTVSNSFVDSDKVKHLEFSYDLNIVK
jgi:Rho GDP-dissociation inhibitor